MKAQISKFVVQSEFHLGIGQVHAITELDLVTQTPLESDGSS